jgi:hypothetical protein
VIDNTRTEEGPVFILQPTAQHHIVEALILPADLSSAPDVVLFTVEVEEPGNLPPQITSFIVEPLAGEADDSVFTATVIASDADGTVDTLSVDFGDGSPPARGTSDPFITTHTYAVEGTYTVTARAVDDVGVPTTSTRQVTVAPHNDPPTGSLHSERTNGSPPQGVGPLTVRLKTQGVDPDGTIATWEIDKDLGMGFEVIAPGESFMVDYPFREEPYIPVLRLTDDLGEAAEFSVDQEIVVLRDVSGLESSVTVSGNPRYENTTVAPAVWADGSDPLRFTIQVRDSHGLPVSNVRVRVATTRTNLIAPDGTNLGPTTSILPNPILFSDETGTVSGTIVTNTSTRVEGMPGINLVPFGLFIEVDLARDHWVPLDLKDVALNADATVGPFGSRVHTQPLLVCPGEVFEIVVEAKTKEPAPGSGGPAVGKYTELRNGTGGHLAGHRPLPGYENWRTDENGAIHFRYVPVRADQSKIFIAWVDGQPLDDLGALFLKPQSECGGI